MDLGDDLADVVVRPVEGEPSLAASVGFDRKGELAVLVLDVKLDPR